MMENIQESLIPTEIGIEDPEFAQQLQDIHDYLKKTPFSKAFPNKYKAITKTEAKKKTYELFLINPNMPLKKVVSTVLNGLDDTLSASLVLEITRVIIDKWEKLTTETLANKHVEELV
jgi:hypothetical protein